MSFGSRRTCSTNGRMAIFAELGMPLFTGNPRRSVPQAADCLSPPLADRSDSSEA